MKCLLEGDCIHLDTMIDKHVRSHILAANIRKENGMGESDDKEESSLLEEGCLYR